MSDNITTSSSSVRDAKANFSSILEMATHGQEVVITSNGKPKAKLVPVDSLRKQQPFHLSPGYKAPPWRGGPTADEIIREDRDSRGW